MVLVMPAMHPGKLRWNPKMVGLEDDFLFNLVIFRFHLNFQGCIHDAIFFVGWELIWDRNVGAGWAEYIPKNQAHLGGRLHL